MYNLTEQETKVFELLKEGKTSEEIAKKMHIALNTVKTHEYRLYKKTGIKGRMELLQNEIKKLKKSIDKKI